MKNKKEAEPTKMKRRGNEVPVKKKQKGRGKECKSISRRKKYNKERRGKEEWKYRTKFQIKEEMKP